MLMLTRNIGQAVHIGNDIVLRLVSKTPDRVWFSVTAPKDTTVAFLCNENTQPRTVPLAPDTLQIRRGDTVRITHPNGDWCDVLPFAQFRRNTLTIGFGAPRLLPVHREEVARRIAAEQRNGMPAGSIRRQAGNVVRMVARTMDGRLA